MYADLADSVVPALAPESRHINAESGRRTADSVRKIATMDVHPNFRPAQ